MAMRIWLHQEYIREKSAQPPIPAYNIIYLKWHSNVSM